MDFKAVLVLDASPALLGVMNRFADVAMAVVTLPSLNQVSKSTESVDQVSVPETVTLITQPVQSNATVTQPEQTPESEEAQDMVPAVKYTKEQIKAAAAAKKDKRDEMKKILDEMGAKSIPTLSEDQYEEFMQKISIL